MRNLSTIKVLNDTGATRLSLVRDIDQQKFYIEKNLKVRIDFQKKIFENEIKLHSSLKHSHLIRFVERTGDNSFLMEYAAKGNLIDQSSAETRVKINWLIQVLKGLKYLHDNGIVHNDLKPSNILITGDKKAMLSDFALAGKVGKKNFENIPDYFIQGSEQFMHSSRKRDKVNTFQNDYYPLGIILYLILVRKNKYSEIDLTKIKDIKSRRLIKSCLDSTFENISYLINELRRL